MGRQPRLWYLAVGTYSDNLGATWARPVASGCIRLHEIRIRSSLAAGLQITVPGIDIAPRPAWYSMVQHGTARTYGPTTNLWSLSKHYVWYYNILYWYIHDRENTNASTRFRFHKYIPIICWRKGGKSAKQSETAQIQCWQKAKAVCTILCPFQASDPATKTLPSRCIKMNQDTILSENGGNKCHHDVMKQVRYSAIRISHFAFCFKCILHSQHRPASRQLSGCWSSSQAAQRLPSSPRTSAVHLKIL